MKRHNIKDFTFEAKEESLREFEKTSARDCCGGFFM
jgi:hypothetical protein